MTTFGYVAEPHRNGYFLVSPATKEGNGEITCHDLSGFCGSWAMRQGGVFFESETGEVFCQKASEKANKFAEEKNKCLQFF